MKNTLIVLGCFCLVSQAFGWGETGHHLIGRLAARLLPLHPEVVEKLKSGSESEKLALKEFLNVLQNREIQHGHVSNIPDIYYRNLDDGLEEDGQIVGDTTHFLDPENVLPITSASEFFKTKLSLNYEEAKAEALKLKPGIDFFHKFGTAPWRGQQFYDLYRHALNNYPKEACKTLPGESHPTRVTLTYAGLISHFLGDLSQPFHASADYDGVATGQKGIHSYFESEIVENLERGDLVKLVFGKARAVMVGSGKGSLQDFTRRSLTLYPTQNVQSEITAMSFTLAGDSYAELDTVRKLDKTYAIATLEEALKLPHCAALPQLARLKTEMEKLTTEGEKTAFLKTKVLSEADASGKVFPACRRSSVTKVDAQGNLSVHGRTVAAWFQPMIQSRLALSAVLLSDAWVKGYLQSSMPKLCWTYKYALKPKFISPTDPQCFGYALKEDPNHFLKKDKTSALPWKQLAKSTSDCL